MTRIDTTPRTIRIERGEPWRRKGRVRVRVRIRRHGWLTVDISSQWCGWLPSVSLFQAVQVAQFLL